MFYFHRKTVSILVTVSKGFDLVVLHAEGGAWVLTVALKIRQARPSHKVSQVAIIGCEVIVSWASGVRMAEHITRTVFPVWDAEEEIVFVPDNRGDVGGTDGVVYHPTSHIQALLPTRTLGAFFPSSLQENRLKWWTCWWCSMVLKCLRD